MLLEPVSLAINAGEVLLVAGPSGCGKSTLLKILASLLTASGGEVLFNGQSLKGIAPEKYRQKVSYCFQTPMLFGETVHDNLAFPWLIRHKKVDVMVIKRWLHQVNLPVAILDKKPEQLSGGEKQRVALLRNLQFLPDVLLLDEATSALDEENKNLINQLISSLVQERGMAAISVSHDTAEICQAQRLLTLQKPVGSTAYASA